MPLQALRVKVIVFAVSRLYYLSCCFAWLLGDFVAAVVSAIATTSFIVEYRMSRHISKLNLNLRYCHQIGINPFHIII